MGELDKIDDFKFLKELRNKMAHSDAQLLVQVRAIMESQTPQQSLESTLRKLMNSLLTG